MSRIDFALMPENWPALDSEGVQRNRLQLGDLWQAAEPDLDVARGALSALVVSPAAALLEVGRETFALARKSSSLSALVNDSSATAQEMLDELAAGYRVSRKPGSPASGTVRLFFRENVPKTIGVSTLFEANGILFNTSAAENLLPYGEAPTTLARYQTMRRTEDGSGLYYADIVLTAQTAGSAGNLMQGTELALYQSNLSYFVRAVALETFRQGENDESNDSLIQRMLYGVSAKVLSSRINMKASLSEMFPDIRDSSVIGAGDPEMTRDRHTAFPGSAGGYCDWYIGTTRQLAAVSVTTDRITDLETFADGSVLYSVFIDNELIPCLYHVRDIQDDETSEFCEIVQQTRNLQFPEETGLPRIEETGLPRITEVEEGVFTAYHVTEVLFRSKTPLTRIRLYGFHAPGIAEIQQWVLECNQSPVGLDILVKAAIPTDIRFSAVLHVPASGETADLAELQNAVASYINGIPLNGILAVSGLTALLHQNLPSGSFITGQALFSSTFLPDGRIVTGAANDRLVIDLPPYATNRTSLFFCDPVNVSFVRQYVEKGPVCA
jgi:hypothetical protein